MDSKFDSQPSKNQKTSQEDKISHLPDAVCCYILSFVPTKYSIRTSILSKRWENLWALSPKINLELNPGSIFKGSRGSEEQYQGFKELCANTFAHSVDNLFSIRGSSLIEIFKLCFQGSLYSFGQRPSSWIRAAIMCNVRELDLTILSEKNGLGELPLCIFTSTTLEILKLSGGFILNVPHYVCIPNLKTLCLDAVSYSSDASIQKLLAGCPILDDLQIARHEWDGMLILDVGISSVKKLKLHCSMDGYIRSGRQYKIVVDAPNLEFIDIMDTCLVDISIKDLPNIVEARLDIFRYDMVVWLSKVLQTIVNVRRLYISEGTMRFLCSDVGFALPTFRNLVQLALYYTPVIEAEDLHGYLCSCPKLESLYLSARFCLPSVFLREGVAPPEPVPECLLNSLKTLQMQEFYGEEVEYDILTYFLENCMVLEKLIIFCRFSPTSKKSIELQDFLTTDLRLLAHCQLNVLYSCYSVLSFCFS